MPYNPAIHHRRSIRLKGYDYSQAGMYFVTICVSVGANLRVRPNLFGEIVDGKMILNDAGKMIEKWCAELSHKFSDIVVDTYIVMPNHFHAIIVNNGGGNRVPVPAPATVTVPVGADLRVCPNKLKNDNISGECPDILGERGNQILGEHGDNILGEHMDDILGEHVDDILGEHVDDILGEHMDDILGEHIGSPLHRVIQWFKTMSTNEYIRGVKTLGWQPFNKKLWQRDYWERIIRNEKSYQYIANYITNNPANWQNDTFYMK